MGLTWEEAGRNGNHSGATRFTVRPQPLYKYEPINPQAVHIVGHRVVPATRLRIRWGVVALYVAAIVLTTITFVAPLATARITAGCDVLALMLLIAWVRPSKAAV